MSQYSELKKKKQDLESRFRYSKANGEAQDIYALFSDIKNSLDSKSEDEIISYLQEQTKNLKLELAKPDVKRDSIRNKAYALCMYSLSFMYKKKYNADVVPYEEQITAAILMDEGYVIEMGTGEGKTLTSMLPAYLNALEGRQTHILTCDDYLVKQGYDDYHETFDNLGLSSSFVTDETTDIEKQERYKADIVYATSKRVAFDYLHDQEVTDLDKSYFSYPDLDFKKVNNVYSSISPFGSIYAVFDEFDHLAIDEAKTPHVDSSRMSDITKEDLETYKQTLLAIDKFVTDSVLQRGTTNFDSGYLYKYSPSSGQIELTKELYDTLENSSELKQYMDIYKQVTNEDPTLEFGKMIQKSLVAHLIIKKDKNYLLTPARKNPIQLIDTSIGKVAEGKKYDEELHGAILAKEINLGNINRNYKFEIPSQKVSSILFKNFLNLYQKKSGMTGTARENIDEFGKMYSMKTISIPSHFKNPKCKNYDIQTFNSDKEKNMQILSLIKSKSLEDPAQPILIGTNSVQEAERFARILESEFKKANSPRSIVGINDSISPDALDKHIILLTAKNQEAEDEIVKKYAGKPNCIIVSTNMVGRGVDFKVDKEVKDKGLCVISTSLTESLRYEKQLRGRAGRQGAAGESYAFASLEDENVRKSTISKKWDTLTPRRARHLQRRLERNQESERISTYRKYDPIELFRGNYFAARLQVSHYDSKQLLDLLVNRYLENYQNTNNTYFEADALKDRIISEIIKEHPDKKELHKDLVDKILTCYKDGWIAFQNSQNVIQSMSALGSFTKQEDFQLNYQENLIKNYDDCMKSAEINGLSTAITKLMKADRNIDFATEFFASCYQTALANKKATEESRNLATTRIATAK